MTALVVAFTVAGCGKPWGPSPTPSSMSTTAAGSTVGTSAAPPEVGDYSTLLIAAAEAGQNATTPGPPQLNPGGKPGVQQTFSSPDGARRIVDTITVFPDAATAASNFTSTSASLSGSVTGAAEPIAVGDGGSLTEGTSPDGAKAVTVVLFTEGRALVQMSFESGPGAGVPKDVALQIAKKQDDVVKAGLPN